MVERPKKILAQRRDVICLKRYSYRTGEGKIAIRIQIKRVTEQEKSHQPYQATTGDISA
jgi:hypothetical protein